LVHPAPFIRVVISATLRALPSIDYSNQFLLFFFVIDKLTVISKLFSGDFKKNFDLIHNDVIRSFPSLKLSQPILKEVFTQFLSYYHDFQRLLSSNTNLKTISANISLPNLHQLMVEIKKFKLPFDGDQFKPRS
jgi:hypothetical protein